MTFTEIVDDIKDRLNLSSSDATTRIGKAVNRKYKEVTSSLGMVVSRRTEVQADTTEGVRTLTFDGIEKISAVIDRSSGTDRLLREVTYEEMKDVAVREDDLPAQWAVYRTGPDTVTIYLDCNPQSEFTLYAEGLESKATLSGSDEPTFSESYHDVLVEAVLVDEYRKLEKFDFMKASKVLYDTRMSELRLWISLSSYNDIHQGKRASSNPWGSAGGGSGSAVDGGTSYTQTGLITFDRDPLKPFAVSSGSAVVANLDADKLDGKDAPTGAIVGISDVQTLTNKTITAPAISSPVLSGTATGSYTLAGTPVVSSSLSLTSGQLVFPAVQVPAAGVNTLDDYEEGSWTPVIGGVGGTSGQTYSAQSGTYVKVGKFVYASFDVTLSAKGTITGSLQISGLPFTIESAGGAAMGFWAATVSTYVYLSLVEITGTTGAAVYGATAAATGLTALATADIGNSTRFLGTLCYRASA